MWYFLLYSKVTQLYIYIFFLKILFCYDLSQDIEYCLLCYTVGLCCYPFYIYAPVTSKLPLHLSPSPALPWQSKVCSLCL